MADFSMPTLDFGGVAEDLDFSLSDVERGGADDGLGTTRYDRPRIYDSTLGEVSYEHACDFVDGLELCEGYRAFAFVSGNFVFGEVLEAMVERRKAAPRSMTVQTLSMSEENIDSLRNVVDMMGGRLERLRIVLSVYFWGHEHRPGQLVPYLYERLDVPGLELDVAFASIHTKIVTMETLSGRAPRDGRQREPAQLEKRRAGARRVRRRPLRLRGGLRGPRLRGLLDDQPRPAVPEAGARGPPVGSDNGLAGRCRMASGSGHGGSGGRKGRTKAKERSERRKRKRKSKKRDTGTLYDDIPF